MAHGDVAIIGMAVRVPGAPDVETFWQNLVDGVDSISRFGTDDLEPSAFLPVDPSDPAFVGAAGIIEDHACFDEAFFGISPAEAAAMDPQHRLFLEACWTAMEDSGHDLRGCNDMVSVYAGCASNTYLLGLLPGADSRLRSYQGLVGNEKDYLATRVSYKLNLGGESITVQTACSTSLVAVHLACTSLLSGQSDIALAGGVSVQANQRTGYLYHPDAIFSPDGSCRAFDQTAQGTVFSNGLGVVVLRRLDDAVAEGDRIYAVIRGSAVNNDASAKVSYTAPSVDAQAAVVATAIDIAGIDAGTIGYVEAHGTGTSIGDPIEVAALTQAFRVSTDAIGSCLLGSVKTNIGHLNVAAGVVGLVKAALAVQRGFIPRSLGFERPNPAIDFESSPFRVAAEGTAWTGAARPRRAGVSSFGIGGTNAHVVLEEAPEPERPQRASERSHHVLALSARDHAALDRLAQRHVEALSASDVDIENYAFTTNTGRATWRNRLAVVGTSAADLRSALSSASGRVSVGDAAPRRRRVALAMAGNGGLHPGVGADLMRSETAFRAAVERCHASLSGNGWVHADRVVPGADSDLTSAPTSITQPATFVLEYALAEQWRAWGLHVVATLGHSLGEIAAACIAGRIELDGALAFVCARGELAETCEGGAMVAVFASEDDVRRLIAGESVEIAAINGAHQVLLSGEASDVTRVVRRFEREGVLVRAVEDRYGYHSALLDGVEHQLKTAAARLRPSPGSIEFHSSVERDAAGSLDAEYWWTQLRGPVRFTDAVDAALATGIDTVVEIGPTSTLTRLVRPRMPAGGLVLNTLDRDLSAWESSALAAAALFNHGVDLDWAAWDAHEPRRRTTVPTYPFARRNHWIDAARRAPLDAPIDIADRLLADAPAGVPASTRQAVEDHIAGLAEQLLGLAANSLDRRVPLPALGLDSIVMIEALHVIETVYGVTLRVRDLLDGELTIQQLAAEVDVAAVRRPQPPLPPTTPSVPTVDLPGSGGSETVGVDYPDVQGLMSRQLEILASVASKQMEVLQALVAHHGAAPQEERRDAELEPGAVERGRSWADEGPLDEERLDQPAPLVRSEAFVPHQPIAVEHDVPEAATDESRRLDDFMSRYQRRTAGSKRIAAEHRSVLADNDNRVVSNFRLSLKEIVYPIAAERSNGSRLWDVDGNEYVDVVMGFGSSLFGHSPEFVTSAVQEQLGRGVHVGAQSDRAGQVAARISRLTGVERVAFCNSGSEAVMAALRVARAATRRRTVAMFAGSYHGVFDGTLGRQQRLGSSPRALPLAPGVIDGMVADLLILDYASPRSLEILADHGADLAAVLVEPVQSRRPDIAPRRFLHELRAVCDATGAALIFDEMITGFRSAPGGAQEFFGVGADLATYGKVLGGGLPIGAIGGRAWLLDAIDGGAWTYGDGSYPNADTTFFAGTFSKHPLAMAAADGVLAELERRGAGLQESISERAQRLEQRLSAAFESLEAPVEVRRHASLFRLVAPRDLHMLVYGMVHHGVHIREAHNCFLSDAHDDHDIDLIVEAATAAIRECRDFGRLASRTHGAADPPREIPSSVNVPLTPAQQQMLSLFCLDPRAGAAYNQASAVRLRGPLDHDALDRAVAVVVGRHDALRTTFDPMSDHQTVHREMVVLVDRGRVDGDVESEFADLSSKPFDLGAGPLVRFHLRTCGPDEYVLIMVASHLVADGWSLGVIFTDLAAAYGDATNVSASAPQFGSYVEWLASRVGTETHRDATERWAATLAPAATLVPLPNDRARPAAPTYQGGRESLRLDRSLVLRLREAAARHAATLPMCLFAGFASLLVRVSSTSVFAIGVPVAGRSFPGGATTVGHCANLVPVPVDATGATLADVVEGARRSFLDLFDDEHLQFGDVARLLGERFGRTSGSIVNVAFNVDRTVAVPQIRGLAVEPLHRRDTGATFDLVLNAVDDGDELLVHLDYALDAVDPPAAKRWAAMYVRMLDAIASSPDSTVSDVDVIGDAGRDELAGLGAGPAGPRSMRTVDEMFRRQVERTPDQPAIDDGETQLNYRALAARVDAVASILGRHGIGSGATIVVTLPRGVALASTILASYGIGAAVAIVAPDRIGSIDLRSLDAAAVVTDGPTVLDADIPRIDLTAASAGVEQGPTSERPTQRSDLSSPAVVLFTSGSAGAPQGIVLSHLAIGNRVAWQARQSRWWEADALVAWTSGVGFVDSTTHMLSALVAGSTVVVGPPGDADVGRLVRFVAEKRITHLVTVPSLLDVFLDVLGPSPNLPELRQVTSSGEPLRPDVVERFRHQLAHVRLLNAYGSTEVAGDVTVARVDSVDTGRVPVGVPIDGCDIRILDSGQRLVPRGTVGEVAVEGAPLATRYLDPIRTASRFVPTAWSDQPGDRLFLTGDLGRWREDGQLELLGRSDRQVQVGGVRVEPGEVEAALGRDERVRACAVVSRRSHAGDVELVAFVEAEPAAIDGIVRDVRRRLPGYMVPAQIVVVAELPRAAAGKVAYAELIDRAAVVTPSQPAGRAPVSPRTPVETVVHDAWAAVVGGPIDVDAMLVEVAASSLSTMRAVVRLREAVGIEITMTDLFENPTITDLAVLIEQRLLDGASDRVEHLLAELEDA